MTTYESSCHVLMPCVDVIENKDPRTFHSSIQNQIEKSNQNYLSNEFNYNERQPASVSTVFNIPRTAWVPEVSAWTVVNSCMKLLYELY
jgi:hypothetical protein